MKRLILVAALTTLAATPAVSQRSTQSPDAEDQGRELSSLQADWRDERVRSRKLRADATEAAAELVALDRQLTTLRRDQTVDDVQIQSQRARLAELSRRDAVLVAALSREREIGRAHV